MLAPTVVPPLAAAALNLIFFAYAVALQVCALLTGGGYAEKVVVPAGQLLPVTEGVSLTDSPRWPPPSGPPFSCQSPLPR